LKTNWLFSLLFFGDIILIIYVVVGGTQLMMLYLSIFSIIKTIGRRMLLE